MTPTYRTGLGDETGRVIMEVGGRLEWRYGPGETVEVVDIEVDGPYRRKKLGRKMLQRLFDEVRPNASSVYAITRSDNMIAQQFYESLNFNVVGVLRRFYDPDGPGIDAVMYGRSLSGPI